MDMAFNSLRQRIAHASAVAAVTGLATGLLPGFADAAAPSCGRVYLVNDQNELLTLQRKAPFLAQIGESGGSGQPVGVRSRLAIGGLASSESFIGVDVRPSTGVLYGVGRIGTDTVGQLYTIDTSTALATPVGARTIPLNGVGLGSEFNPVPDRLRIVSDTGQNIRVRPADGTVAGTDTALAYPATGDPNATRIPRVVAIAYTNPDGDAQTNTVLHDIDVNRAADPDRVGDVLAIQVPPNGGVLNTVGNLRIDADDMTAFDIGRNNEAF